MRLVYTVPTDSWTFLRATLPLLILSSIAAMGSTVSASKREVGSLPEACPQQLLTWLPLSISTVACKQ